jgi:two-component system, NarL family, sensor histidine kinase FusK
LIWAPAGIALGALLLGGLRLAPGVLIGALAVNLTLTGHFWSSFGIAIGNTLEGVAGAWLIRRYAGGFQVFERTGDVFRFALLGPVLSTTLAATVGVGCLALAGLLTFPGMSLTWLDWWVGDAIGQMVVTPALMLAWRRVPRPPRTASERAIGILAASSALIVGTLLVLRFGTAGAMALQLKFLVIPLLVWCAFQLRPHETAAVVAVLMLIGAAGATGGFDPSAPGAHTHLLIFQIFMGTSALASLVVSAAVVELAREHEATRQARDQLEERVARRTAQLSASLEQRREAEVALAELSRRLIRLRDEERHRIARELHEGIAQLLGALQMQLGTLQRRLAGVMADRDRDLMQESGELVRHCSDEVRTMSYLLHPPLLDEEGLPAALAPYFEGFTRRSGIEVDWQTDTKLERLPAEVELSVFRILQECLTNVYRHSKSPHVVVRLDRNSDGLAVEVRDAGTGMPRDAREGPGLRGIRERLHELGGTLEIDSNESGTRVRMVIPLPENAAV